MVASFWAQALTSAAQLSPADLKRHAGVSTNNRHTCRDCFCCACAEVLREQKARTRAEKSPLRRQVGFA